MAGPEANRFLCTDGDECLSNEDTFGGLDRVRRPAAALRLRGYRRARARILAFAQAALAERAAHPHDGPMDLLDHALAATDENGEPYPARVRSDWRCRATSAR